MNEKDKNIITKRYRDRLKNHGSGIEVLASGSTDRREIRFNILNSVGDLRGKRILDVGCGLADFYDWLKERNIEVNYTGYDITAEFIDLSAKRFPEARFEVRDIQSEGIPEKFDYIVSSQTFNNRLDHEDNFELMQDILKTCYEASESGVVVDMTTSYVDFEEEKLYYYQPEEVFRYAKSLTKLVKLRHDYPAYEFAIFLYKDFVGWRT